MPAYRRGAIALALLALVLFSLVAPPLRAAGVLYVCPAGCPFTSIGAALASAQAGDTILVGTGIYPEHLAMKAGVAIRGENSNACILTGGGTDTVVRAQGDDIGPSTVLEGFTIIAGKAANGGGIHIGGGASPTIRNNLITANTAGDSQSFGGGVFISGGAPVITGNTFSKNYASWAGGAIAVWDGSRATISGNYIVDNKAFQYGGAVNVTGASPTISGNTVISNSAYYGGGVDASDAALELVGNLIVGNLASINGGGIYLRNLSRGLISTNAVISNTAYYYGGGLYMDRSTPSVTGNTVQYNLADSGGGIYVDRSSPSVAKNRLLSNTAAYYGGGVYLNGSSASVIGNDILGNVATVGGGGLAVRGASWPEIRNNIVADNAVGFFGGAAYIYGSGPSLMNNLIVRNFSSSWAGGIYVDTAWPTINNNTVVGNGAAGNGEGIYLSPGSSPTITNNIVASNTYGIVVINGEGVTIERNNVWGNTGADFLGVPVGNNISANPLFVPGMDGKYYLSQVAAGQAVDSPSVDAGTDTAENLGLADRTTATHGFPDEGQVDMGYHYRALFRKAYLAVIIGNPQGARQIR